MEQLRRTYCGGLLQDHGDHYICESCRTKIQKTAMELLSEQDIFDLNAARRLKETFRFDEAQAAYDEVLRRNPDCEEAAWGAFLSEYGIEYQAEEQKPTFHALSAVPVYKSRYYDKMSPEHQHEADETIEFKRREIMKNAETLPSYDVFLSLKIDGEGGAKTPEYEWAMQLYYDLREQGYKVFFSPQVLKTTNADWEPYIYRAIQTCRIMLVLTSSIDNATSPWVRNEWRRILSRVKNTPAGEQAPAYRVIATDMNCVPTELMGKQVILRNDYNFKGLVEQAVAEACRGKESPPKPLDNAVTSDKWSRQADETVVVYLGRIRNAAFTSSEVEKKMILSTLKKEQNKEPLKIAEFFLLIKRVETQNFRVIQKGTFDESSLRFLIERAETDPEFAANEDYLALSRTSFFVSCRGKWMKETATATTPPPAPRPVQKPAAARPPRKKHTKLIIILILVAAGIFGGVRVYNQYQYYNTTEREADGRIRIGFDEEDLINRSYTSVESMLKKAGFTDVELEVSRTLTNETSSKRDKVKSVVISGNSLYEKGDKFDEDVSIVITYYDFPENTVFLTFSVGKLKGQNYEDIVSDFEEAGFTNIELTPVTEGVTSAGQDGQVISVSINNESDFAKGEGYANDSKVEISYYSVPEGTIFIPFSHKDFTEKNYRDVLSQFQSAGFVNIELIPIEDLITGWLTKDGQVEDVTIGGSYTFKKGDPYAFDTKITISYHTFSGDGETLPAYSGEVDTTPKEEMIKINFSSKELKDEDYRDVRTRFEKAGFTNITVEPLKDLVTGWIDTKDAVESVSINGQTTFSAGDSFPKDAEIRIVYHAFK